MTEVNRNTAILLFHKPREVIFEELAASEPGLAGGEIEVDESYFGGRRQDDACLLALEARRQCTCAIIPNARSDTLFPIIRGKVRPDSIIYTDSFGAYDVLDISEFHHIRINHSELFVDDVTALVILPRM